MVDWTKDALEAALNTFDADWWLGSSTMPEAMRAALDAAVKAQSEIKMHDYAYHAPSYRRGRAEALAQAAREVEDCDGWEAGRIAARIRALKDTLHDK